MIRTIQFALQTRGHCDVKDVTSTVSEALTSSGLQEGQATVFVAGSTAGVTTVEFEPGLVKDLNVFFKRSFLKVRTITITIRGAMTTAPAMFARRCSSRLLPFRS